MAEQLLSVGIDVGTSTTQLVFSRLLLEDMASAFSVPRVAIADKEVIYRSDVYFTPLLSERVIDHLALRTLIEKEYDRAGVRPEAVDTGAVIITGETARKENAAEVLNALSGLAGDFVVATAGADLEGIIAAKGAGLDQFTKEHGVTGVNVDIGGGTSNFAVFAQGEVIDTGCLDIGGRLLKIDNASGRITYIMPKIRRLIEAHGLAIDVGDDASAEKLLPLAQLMAEMLCRSVGLLPANEESLYLETNKGLRQTKDITHISFSGGVADYIYMEHTTDDWFRYGDIGILLAHAIKESPLCREFTVIKGRETIGATVVGAGNHTVNVSGSTISYSSDLFPLKNLPIIKFAAAEEDRLAELLPEKIAYYPEQIAAIGLGGRASPTFHDVIRYAEAIEAGLADYPTARYPVVIVLKEDMAMVLGQTLLSRNPHWQLVCLDGVLVENGDYIDIGKPVFDGTILPVVIKTIVFNQ